MGVIWINPRKGGFWILLLKNVVSSKIWEDDQKRAEINNLLNQIDALMIDQKADDSAPPSVTWDNQKRTLNFIQSNHAQKSTFSRIYYY